MPVEVGPTYINPYDPGSPGGYNLDSGWTIQFENLPADMVKIEMIGIAARNMLLNGEGICDAAATGNSQQVMSEAFKGLSGKDEFSVRQQLKAHCEASQIFLSAYSNIGGTPFYIGNGRGAYIEPIYGSLLIEGPLTYEKPFPLHSIDFYGTPAMPLAAIGYWIFGGGQARNVHVESLNLQMVARDFQPIKALLDDPSRVGAFPIKGPFSYNIFDKAPIDLPAAGMLGRVSGNVEGTLEIKADNSYVFYGIYTLDPDLYDAAQSNRTWAQEALTTFLNGLGDAFGHTDYYINFLGSKTVQLSGTR